ncbi:MAG: PA4642 family protein [Pseudomonadales bacterium]|nr:PA4642 family protein [Pseudomonadales bacterium]
MKTEKKSGAERTQLAVHDEWWSDERLRSFLTILPTASEARDFHILRKAYQGMVPETFARFMVFFVEAGHNINERNSHGQTILGIVSQHRNSGEYAAILKQAGAQL